MLGALIELSRIVGNLWTCSFEIKNYSKDLLVVQKKTKVTSTRNMFLSQNISPNSATLQGTREGQERIFRITKTYIFR